MEKITLRKTVRYALLPGIIPGVTALFSSGFSSLAMLVAYLFYVTRIFPAGHAYLKAENKGRFGIRHVLAEGINSVTFSRKNIDQIVVLAAVILALVLVFCQISMVVFSALVTFAHATPTLPTWSSSIFVVEDPSRDVAYMVLDKVFGIPGFFGSEIGPVVPTDIPPFQLAMGLLFSFYSKGILYICLLLLVYYAIVFVLESIKDGVPFGNRFQSFYAPMRLVIAISLLIPLGYGYNTGQYFVLHVAKLGSALGTNAWQGFNQSMANPLGTPGGTTVFNDNNPLVAKPSNQFIGYLTEFGHILGTCRMYYERKERPDSYNSNIANLYNVLIDPDAYIQPYYYNPSSPVKFELATNAGVSAMPFNDVLNYFGDQDIVIRFGHLQDNNNVGAECGEIRVPNLKVEYVRGLTEYNWAMVIQYMNLANYYAHYGARAVELIEGSGRPCDVPRAAWPFWNNTDDPCFIGGSATVDHSKGGLPLSNYLMGVIDFEQLVWNSSMNSLWATSSSEIDINEEIMYLGWGGAGLWFNKIAEVNNTYMTASTYLPEPIRYPEIMEKVKQQRKQTTSGVSAEEMYTPVSASVIDGKGLPLNEEEDKQAKTLNLVYLEFHTDDRLDPMGMTKSANIFEKAADMVFGVGGLSDIRDNTDVHPLAQMTALGSNMINQSIRHMMGAMTASAMGGYLKAVHNEGDNQAGYGSGFAALTGVFTTLFSVSVVAGFILGYMVPILPFMYMFLAMGKWVKSVFEAMVGVPLWALAHMRIDGNGIPGPLAGDGYLMILEIFIRPILCVFGLIASMVVFSAIMGFLHTYFWLLVENTGGISPIGVQEEGGALASFRKGFDEFFYTVMYCMLAYILATSNFKLIDMIPNEILRWIGGNVKAFADGGEDPTDRMTLAMTYGGQRIAGSVAEAGSGLANISGEAIGRAQLQSKLKSGGA